MQRHSDGVTFRTSDSKNIDGRITKIINYNFDGILDSLEAICRQYELEQKRKIKFLDILLIRNPENYYIYIYEKHP